MLLLTLVRVVGLTILELLIIDKMILPNIKKEKNWVTFKQLEVK